MSGFKLSPLMLLSVLTVLASITGLFFWQRSDVDRAALAAVVKERDSAATIITNVQRTLTIFSQISAERAIEKERDRQQGERDRAALRADLQGNVCSAELLPAAAERRLLEKADRIRSRAVSGPASGAVTGNAGS